MGETPLPLETNDPANHVYRFTCLRSFHQPFCIKLVVHRDPSATLTLRVLSGAAGADPGKLKKTKETAIAKREVDRFLKLLEKERYWQLKNTETRLGFDGSQWIVEGVDSGRYHVVDRWTPDKSTAVGRIGHALLELAGWKVKELC